MAYGLPLFASMIAVCGGFSKHRIHAWNAGNPLGKRSVNVRFHDRGAMAADVPWCHWRQFWPAFRRHSNTARSELGSDHEIAASHAHRDCAHRGLCGRIASAAARCHCFFGRRSRRDRHCSTAALCEYIEPLDSCRSWTRLSRRLPDRLLLRRSADACGATPPMLRAEAAASACRSAQRGCAGSNPRRQGSSLPGTARGLKAQFNKRPNLSCRLVDMSYGANP
jgi:hypothetical protein